MRTQVVDVFQIGAGYVVRGTVDGHPVSVDLPSTYIDRLDRDTGRAYMARCLEKIYVATVVDHANRRS